MSVNDEDAWMRREIDWIGIPLKEDLPFLGICLGGQMLARHLGQRVRPHPHGLVEVGYYPIQPTEQGALHLRLPVPQSRLPMAPGRFRSAVRGDLARQGPGFRGTGLPLSRQGLRLPVPSGSDFRDVVPLDPPQPRAHGRTRRTPPSSPYRRVVPARRRGGALVRGFSAPLARRRPSRRTPRPGGLIASARNRAGSIR